MRTGVELEILNLQNNSFMKVSSRVKGILFLDVIEGSYHLSTILRESTTKLLLFQWTHLR